MTKMKKLASVLLAVVMAMGLAAPAWAAIPVASVSFNKLCDADFDFDSQSQFRYSTAFARLNDQEYNNIIGNLVMNTDNYVMLAERLEKCGIKVGCIKRISPDKTRESGNEIGPNVEDGDITIIATATQRTGSTNWMVGAAIMFAHKESGPDTLDIATLYFDSTKANYISYDVGSTGAITLNSGKHGTQGTLVFNYNDQKMVAGTVYTAMAVIRPTVAKGTRIDFGMDYIHSYSTTSTSLSGFTIQVEFGGQGAVGGSFGAEFNTSKCEHKFPIADTGSFKV